MALRFRYTLVPMPSGIVPLGGRFVRPRPLVPVWLLGSGGGLQADALLDTAADDTVFPERFAQLLGIDLTQAPVGSGQGAGQSPIPLRYAQVTLRLTDGREVREWDAWVGFTAARISRPLLGFAGCLQFFTATFKGDLEEVGLEANQLYSGI